MARFGEQGGDAGERGGGLVADGRLSHRWDGSSRSTEATHLELVDSCQRLTRVNGIICVYRRICVFSAAARVTIIRISSASAPSKS